MLDRIGELERLAKLRDSGVLTEAEYEAEKRHVLTQRLLLSPMVWVPVVIVVLLAIGGGVIWRLDQGLPAVKVAVGKSTVSPAMPDQVMRTAAAFQAAFGHASPAAADIGDEHVVFSSARLIDTSFGPVLVSQGEVENASHASSGKIAVHYLSESGGVFRVTKSFVPAVEAGSFGTLSQWSVSANLTGKPLIYTEGGGTWQGYTCAYAVLTELQPSGPKELASIPIAYDDSGARMDNEKAQSIEGKIDHIVQGKAFDVSYTGTQNFSDHYVRQGDAYINVSKAQMPQC